MSHRQGLATTCPTMWSPTTVAAGYRNHRLSLLFFFAEAVFRREPYRLRHRNLVYLFLHFKSGIKRQVPLALM